MKRRCQTRRATPVTEFFEWRPAEPAASPNSTTLLIASAPSPKPKLRPESVVSAVGLLAADTSDGRVHVGALGSYLRRTDPTFSPQTFGHSGLISMLKTYDLLALRQKVGGH